ncbi:MAG: helix-turn-helix transcriptional regulator [Eubacteriales bacterium]
MNIGKKIKNIRLKKGLTAKELSISSGVTRSLISELETGKRNSTSIETISRIAKALQISPSYFIEQENSSVIGFSYSINEKICEFLNREDSKPYIDFAMQIQEMNIGPQSLDNFIKIINSIRSSTNKKTNNIS